jgi:hypothetical protein
MKLWTRRGAWFVMIKTIVAFVVVAFDSIAINPLPALSKPCASSVLSSGSFSLTGRGEIYYYC